MDPGGDTGLPPDPGHPHVVASPTLSCRSWGGAAEPLTSRRETVGPAGGFGPAVWPNCFLTACQRFCGAPLLLGRGLLIITVDNHFWKTSLVFNNVFKRLEKTLGAISTPGSQGEGIS